MADFNKNPFAQKYKKTLAKRKMHRVMGEFKKGELHSGSKVGPEVHSRKQAIAIGMSEARKAAHDKALSKKKHG